MRPSFLYEQAAIECKEGVSRWTPSGPAQPWQHEYLVFNAPFFMEHLYSALKKGRFAFAFSNLASIRDMFGCALANSGSKPVWSEDFPGVYDLSVEAADKKWLEFFDTIGEMPWEGRVSYYGTATTPNAFERVIGDFDAQFILTGLLPETKRLLNGLVDQWQDAVAQIISATCFPGGVLARDAILPVISNVASWKDASLADWVQLAIQAFCRNRHRVMRSAVENAQMLFLGGRTAHVIAMETKEELLAAWRRYLRNSVESLRIKKFNRMKGREAAEYEHTRQTSDIQFESVEQTRIAVGLIQRFLTHGDSASLRQVCAEAFDSAKSEWTGVLSEAFRLGVSIERLRPFHELWSLLHLDVAEESFEVIFEDLATDIEALFK